MVPNPSHGSHGTTSLNFVISDAKKQQLNRIAYELSEPGERVTPSEIVREAITDYLEKYDQNPEACEPRERGSLGDGIEA